MEKISVLIPAHNEEKYLARCLDSVRVAAGRIDIPLEIVVALNRCTDRTEAIALSYGAILVKEDAKNLSCIRNKAARKASGDVLITLDADSWIRPGTLRAVVTRLTTGRYVGGGVLILLERFSLGIFFSISSLLPYLFKTFITGGSGGMFWLYKKDFEAIGGFDEQFISVEDYHFYLKLKAYGKTKDLKYGTLWKDFMFTSCRKFDQFGDWYLFRNPKIVKSLFTGKDRKAADAFYYEARNGTPDRQ
jgi:glycosyltransferase involved in cell wall biosynthesis